MKHLKNYKLFEAKKEEIVNEDADFFQSLIGKKIKCKKQYNWRKNSLTSAFAFVDDIMKIESIDIYVEGKSSIRKCEYEKLEKELANGDKVRDFTIHVKNLTKKKEDDTWYKSKYVPAVKSKKQFLTYFEII